MQWICSYTIPRIVRILINQDAQVDGIAEAQDSTLSKLSSCHIAYNLIQAIRTTQISRIELLVSAGARIDSPARFNVRRTPFQAAVKFGSLDIINYFLQRGADINKPPAIRDSRTTLQLATVRGLIGIAYILIERGAFVNAPAGKLLGRTAFESAAENGRIEILSFLVDYGVGLITDSGRQCQRTIMFAKCNGHYGAIDLVEYLYADACHKVGIDIMLLLDSGL